MKEQNEKTKRNQACQVNNENILELERPVREMKSTNIIFILHAVSCSQVALSLFFFLSNLTI